MSFDASKLFARTVSLRAIFESSQSDMAETSSDSAADFCAEAFVCYVYTGFCFWHLLLLASRRVLCYCLFMFASIMNTIHYKYIFLAILHIHVML